LGLALQIAGFYCRGMKRISLLLVTMALWAPSLMRGEDAATEERLNKLAGRIEDLLAGQDAMRKHVEALERELANLREQVGKPTGNYAAEEDLKRVAKAVEEVDRKRVEDAEKVKSELLRLQKAVTSAPAVRSHSSATPPEEPARSKPEVPDKGFEYIVKKGDTLSIIVQAYREKNIKVSTDQILKANPNLKPEKMYIGQKIFIPAPKQMAESNL
jgi:LysM repeat protein